MEDITNLAFSEVAERVQKLHPSELQAIMPKLTQEQTLAVVHATNEMHDPEWRLKTLAMVLGVTERQHLEVLGRDLSASQFLEIFNHLSTENPKELWRLPPLFVEMPHEQFAQVLIRADNSQMLSLTHEVLTEPVQHQLKLLCREWMKGIETLCSTGMELEKKINSLDLKELTYKILLEILNRISTIQNSLEELGDSINKALKLCWNTNRLDLIEKFGLLKELAQKSSILIVGHPHTEKEASKGLYSVLENKLYSVFGQSGSTPDINTLNDEDPSVEALSRLSIWYLEDYWKLGLIPSVHDVKTLHASNYAEPEYEALQVKWMEEANNTLASLGLNKVVDFKEKAIFSQDMLKEYIQHHQKS